MVGEWHPDSARTRYRQIVRHGDLAAHERYLSGMLATYRGPHRADWQAELARTRAALAALAPHRSPTDTPPHEHLRVPAAPLTAIRARPRWHRWARRLIWMPTR